MRTTTHPHKARENGAGDALSLVVVLVSSVQFLSPFVKVRRGAFVRSFVRWCVRACEDIIGIFLHLKANCI